MPNHLTFKTVAPLVRVEGLPSTQSARGLGEGRPKNAPPQRLPFAARKTRSPRIEPVADLPYPPSVPQPIHIVGGGLAGSEAAWQIARAGVPVVLHEMRPERQTEAHKTDAARRARLLQLASAPTTPSTNAVGLLHEEMRRAGSLIMAAGDRHKLPAGGALAVDRDGFSDEVTRQLAASTRSSPSSAARSPACRRAEWDSVIIATGPLTSPALSEAIAALTGEDRARLLRRHRPDRAPGVDRRERHLAPVALRQGGARRQRRRLHQLPDEPGRVRGLRRCAAGGREDLASRSGRPPRPISTAACPSR